MDAEMYAVYLAIALVGFWSMPLQAQILVNRQAPTAQGFLAWYRDFPGLSGGRFWYDPINRFHSTLTNMGSGSGWRASSLPWMKSVVVFDGTDDHVVLPTTAVLEPPARTVTLWLNMAATIADYVTIMGTNTVTDYWKIYLAVGNKIAVYYQTTEGDFGIDVLGGTTITAGEWFFLSVQFSAAQNPSLRIHVNCRLDQSQQVTAFPLVPSGASLLLGASNSPAQYFLPGTLTDIRLFNRALPDQELCTIMREAQQGEPTLLPPPVLALGVEPSAPSGARGSFVPFFGQP